MVNSNMAFEWWVQAEGLFVFSTLPKDLLKVREVPISSCRISHLYMIRPLFNASCKYGINASLIIHCHTF